MKLLSRLFLLGLVTLYSGTAFTQTAADGEAVAEVAEDQAVEDATQAEEAEQEKAKPRIEEVVVTATKRAKSSRDIPITVDAFTAKDLEERGADNISEILKFSPGVMLNESSAQGDANLTIRGISTESRNTLTSRPTGLFYEDINMVNPSTQGVAPDLDPFDMTTVEVLKGPQGTLFGGTALSGAVRYVPNKPDPSKLEGKVQAGGAMLSDSDDYHWQGKAMLNLPIYEDLAVRGSFSRRYRAGYIDDVVRNKKDINDADLQQTNGQVKWLPVDWVSLELGWLNWQVEANGGFSLDNVEDRTTSIRKFDDYNELDMDIYTAKAQIDLGWFTIEGLYGKVEKQGYINADLSHNLGQGDPFPPTVFAQTQQKTADQPSWEVRLVSNGLTKGGWLLRDWEFLVGYFEMESQQYLILNSYEDPTGQGNPDPTSAVLLTNFTEVFAEEQAIFFDVTRVLFDRFEINVGGRFYDTYTNALMESGFQGINQSELTSVDGVLLGPIFGDQINREDLDFFEALVGFTFPTEPVYNEQQESGFNPKVALTWRAADDLSVFVAASRGFRFGGYNPNNALFAFVLDLPYTYKSDTLWNYELGVRSDWFNGLMLLDVTLFHIDWTDLQTQQLRLGIGAYTTNVGAARSQGVEAKLQMLIPEIGFIPPGFFLSLNGAYIDARTTEEFTTADGVTAAPGTRLPSAPEITASGILAWSGGVKDWAISANYSVSYIGETFSTLDKSGGPIDPIISHGLGFSISRPDLVVAPALNVTVTNLMDAKGESYHFLGGAPAEFSAVSITPRTITANLTFSF